MNISKSLVGLVALSLLAASAALGCSAASSEEDIAVGTSEEKLSRIVIGQPKFYKVTNQLAAELVEGMTFHHGDGKGTELLITYPLTGQVARVADDRSITSFGGIVGAPVGQSFTTSVLESADGSKVLVGYNYFGAPNPAPGVVPAPGVYRVPSAGGAATLYASHPEMNFAIGLAEFEQPVPLTTESGKIVLDRSVFVADASGIVFRIDSSGHTKAWSRAPALAATAPGVASCGDNGLPVPVGANKLIALDNDSTRVAAKNGPTTTLVVGNLDRGSLVRIPMNADGTAGAASEVVGNCLAFGIDGFFATSTGFLGASITNNTILEVNNNGTVTPRLKGAPLDSPTTLLHDRANKRVFIANSAFREALSGQLGTPGILVADFSDENVARR